MVSKMCRNSKTRNIMLSIFCRCLLLKSDVEDKAHIPNRGAGQIFQNRN